MPNGMEKIILGLQHDRRWRTEYRADRYMDHLTRAALEERGRDIFLNFMTVAARTGKLSPLPVEMPDHGYWRKRLNEFLEECELRYGPYPAGFERFSDELRIPRPTNPTILRAVEDARKRDLTLGRFLAKFGKRKWLKETLETGRIRIAPASSFNDPLFNPAVQDDELKFRFYVRYPTAENLSRFAKNAQDLHIPPGHAAEITEIGREDHYVYCLAATYEPRLYEDFDADACLIVNDPIEFRERILSTVMEQLKCRGYCFGPVTYVDPLTEAGEGVHLSMRKHFRYAYQNECRSVWLAQRGRGDLQVEFVSIGPLIDIATLVEL